MKIRLTQSGYATYTGQMGVVFFRDGLSIADVRPVDAVRLAAQFLCEWEDGTTASVAQSLLDHAHATTLTIPVEMNADQALAHGNSIAAGHVTEPDGPAPSGVIHTSASLAEVADKEGIAGLRAIADSYGIKGKAINELITAILAKQVVGSPEA